MINTIRKTVPVPGTGNDIQIQVRALPQASATLTVTAGYEDLFVYSCGYSANDEAFILAGSADECLYLSTGSKGTLPAPSAQIVYIAVDLNGLSKAGPGYDGRVIVADCVTQMRNSKALGAMDAGNPPVVTSKP